jgi:hypothetical protein
MHQVTKRVTTNQAQAMREVTTTFADLKHMKENPAKKRMTLQDSENRVNESTAGINSTKEKDLPPHKQRVRHTI